MSSPRAKKQFSASQLKQIRLIDANVNRACEGLRVLEDICRFIRDDASRSEQLKQVRHQLRSAFDTGLLVSHRESDSDVGQGVLRYGSESRIDLISIIIANSKRVQESMRVIEEFAKLEYFNRTQEERLQWESIRYLVYSIEKELLQTEQEGPL